MRTFSNEEKVYIKSICDIAGNRQSNFQSLLNPSLKRVLIHVDKQDQSVSIILDDKDDNINIRSLELERTLIRLLSLILYLEKEGYLVPYDATTQFNPPSNFPIQFGQGEGREFTEYSLPDPNIEKLVASYVDKEMMPTGSLLSLVENNFISEEERRFRKQQYWTVTAIGVSIILGLWSVGSTIWDTHSKAKISEQHLRDESARWQALLAIESNRVVQAGKLNNILLRLNPSIGSLTNQVQPVVKPAYPLVKVKQ